MATIQITTKDTFETWRVKINQIAQQASSGTSSSGGTTTTPTEYGFYSNPYVGELNSYRIIEEFNSPGAWSQISGYMKIPDNKLQWYNMKPARYAQTDTDKNKIYFNGTYLWLGSNDIAGVYEISLDVRLFVRGGQNIDYSSTAEYEDYRSFIVHFNISDMMTNESGDPLLVESVIAMDTGHERSAVSTTVQHYIGLNCTGRMYLNYDSAVAFRLYNPYEEQNPYSLMTIAGVSVNIRKIADSVIQETLKPGI